MDKPTHEKYMHEALKEALTAYKNNEVPIGAIVVYKNEIIARAQNQTITLKDPTAHAEMLVLKKAAAVLNNERLSSSILYVTVEPCAMCAGAVMWARIKHIFYGVKEPKTGVLDSNGNIFQDHHFPHKPVITGGLLENDAKKLMQMFFKRLRTLKSKD